MERGDWLPREFGRSSPRHKPVIPGVAEGALQT